MKNRLLFTMATILLLSGCSGKDSINASNQYVGTYEMTVQITTRSIDYATSKTSSTTATILFKASSSTSLTLADDWGDHYVALVGSGPTFSLTRHSINGSILGGKDIFSRTGEGEFNGNSITMTTYTRNDGTEIKAVYTGSKK